MDKKFLGILSFIVLLVLGTGIYISKNRDKDVAVDSYDATTLRSVDHIEGNKDSKVILIEYGDFECPSCKAWYTNIKEVKEKAGDRVEIVFRHFPLKNIHKNAVAAARASEAASNQGKFWEMHDLLYERQSIWSTSSGSSQLVFEDYAKELGLDLDRFKVDYSSEATIKRIEEDIASGSKTFDIAGTPTFVLGGKKIATPSSVDEMIKLIDAEIAKQ
jgi:protein-disulfide isomerase